MDDNRKLAEKIWRVATQQPGGEESIQYIAAFLFIYGDARYKAGQESMRKEVPDVVVTWASGETVGINDAVKRIKELEAKVLRVLHGDINQMCSYCGWETPAGGGAWEDLQAHIKVCPSHPLRAAEKRIKALIGENEIWQDKFNRQTQAVKDIALMKASIQVQYHLTVARAEAAEAARQFLLDQSSRWEAQALEAGVRIAELEALVRKLQKVLSICRERLQHDKAQKAKRSGAGTSISLRKVDHLLGIISAVLVESQAGGKGER
jgi:hypothetical protein